MPPGVSGWARPGAIAATGGRSRTAVRGRALAICCTWSRKRGTPVASTLSADVMRTRLLPSLNRPRVTAPDRSAARPVATLIVRLCTSLAL